MSTFSQLETCFWLLMVDKGLYIHVRSVYTITFSYQSNQDLILKISITHSNGQKYINNCHLNLQ